MAMDKINCAGCLKDILDDQFLLCIGCAQYYDLQCANVSEHMFRNLLNTQENAGAWRCVECKSKLPKSDNTNTPVRAAVDGVNINRGAAPRNCPRLNASASTTMDLDDTAHNITLEMTDLQLLIMEMRQLRAEMTQELRANRSQLEIMNDNISSLVGRVVTCEERLDNMEERLNTLELRVENAPENGIKSDNSTLTASIAELKSELNDRDQDLLLTEVEISCIPEEKGESLQHIVSTLSCKLGVELTTQDLVSVARVGRVPVMPETESNISNVRPRPIVVRLARRALRDQLLQAARVRRGATTEGTGLPGLPRRFYVNERLTRANRLLFRRARELGNRLKWRYVWTKDGRIFARQSSDKDSPKFRFRTEEDLARVFGRESVGS